MGCRVACFVSDACGGELGCRQRREAAQEGGGVGEGGAAVAQTGTRNTRRPTTTTTNTFISPPLSHHHTFISTHPFSPLSLSLSLCALFHKTQMLEAEEEKMEEMKRQAEAEAQRCA